MSKFTPGPWQVCDDGYAVYYVNPLIEEGEDIDDPSHDSTVASTIDLGCLSGIPDDDRQANCCLIAAAPDLLAECKKAEALLDAILSLYGEGLEVANWHQNGDYELFDNFIDENSDGFELEGLRAAIAKAEGTS